MTLEVVYTVAAAWLGLLLFACAVRVLRAETPAARILALDTLVLVLVGLLASYSAAHDVSYFLDAALVLGLVGFVATVAAARYYGDGSPFT